jgi:hypothetical protein
LIPATLHHKRARNEHRIVLISLDKSFANGGYSAQSIVFLSVLHAEVAPLVLGLRDITVCQVPSGKVLQPSCVRDPRNPIDRANLSALDEARTEKISAYILR